jgi:TolB protein
MNHCASILLSFITACSSLAVAGESEFLGDIHQITQAGRRSGEGYYRQNPKGENRWIIFQSERDAENPFYQIYLKDLKNGTTRRVSPGFGKSTCAWIHPHQDRLLFSMTTYSPSKAQQLQNHKLEERKAKQKKRYSWDYDPHYDVFETDWKGGIIRNLTRTHGYDAEASWSSDGSWIVFASNRDAYRKLLSYKDRKSFRRNPSYMVDLYLMRSDGSELRQLTKTRGYDGGPFFSLDGEKITWRRFTPEGRSAEVYVMQRDGSDEKAVTNLGVVSWAPFFHPSGDYLIFSTNLHGHRNFELYIVDSEGKSKPQRVTYDESFDSLPAFSADGAKMTWTSSRTKTHKPQVFAADWNDQAARKALGL